MQLSVVSGRLSVVWLGAGGWKLLSRTPLKPKDGLIGGLAQGLGGALMENFIYDPAGQPNSVTLADYLMITAAEMPPVKVLICENAPSPLNPLGIKGAGEAGVNAAGAAVASAIDDALQIPGFVDRLPMTPQYLKQRLADIESGTCDARKVRQDAG